MTATRTGRVKRMGARAFGWIERDDGSPDLFFHVHQVEGMDPLQGERVQFVVGEDHRGRPRAAQVRVLG